VVDMVKKLFNKYSRFFEESDGSVDEKLFRRELASCIQDRRTKATKQRDDKTNDR